LSEDRAVVVFVDKNMGNALRAVSLEIYNGGDGSKTLSFGMINYYVIIEYIFI